MSYNEIINHIKNDQDAPTVQKFKGIAAHEFYGWAGDWGGENGAFIYYSCQLTCDVCGLKKSKQSTRAGWMFQKISKR